MADVDDDAKLLRPTDEGLALSGEALPCLMRAGKQVCVVPGQRGHHDPEILELVEPSGIAADHLRPFQREKYAVLALLGGFQKVVRRAAELMGVAVLCKLGVEIRNTADEFGLRLGAGQRVAVFVIDAAEAVDLGMTEQLGFLIQVDMQVVFSPNLIGVGKGDCGVAVQVKYGKGVSH